MNDELDNITFDIDFNHNDSYWFTRLVKGIFKQYAFTILVVRDRKYGNKKTLNFIILTICMSLIPFSGGLLLDRNTTGVETVITNFSIKLALPMHLFPRSCERATF